MLSPRDSWVFDVIRRRITWRTMCRRSDSGPRHRTLCWVSDHRSFERRSQDTAISGGFQWVGHASLVNEDHEPFAHIAGRSRLGRLTRSQSTEVSAKTG